MSAAPTFGRNFKVDRKAKPVPFESCASCWLFPLNLCANFRRDHGKIRDVRSPLWRTMPAESQVLFEGDVADRLLVLSEGWAFRYKMLPDGRRQVIDFVLPGDTLMVPGGGLRGASHSIESITPITLCSFSTDQVSNLIAQSPGFAASLLTVEGEVAARVTDHFLSVGRRRALERMAHLLVEIYLRLKHCGLNNGHSFEFPARQQIIGDALGLTHEHVCRLRRRLNDMGIAEFYRDKVTILDFEWLSKIGGTEDGYKDGPIRPKTLLGQRVLAALSSVCIPFSSLVPAFL